MVVTPLLKRRCAVVTPLPLAEAASMSVNEEADGLRLLIVVGACGVGLGRHLRRRPAPGMGPPTLAGCCAGSCRRHPRRDLSVNGEAGGSSSGCSVWGDQRAATAARRRRQAPSHVVVKSSTRYVAVPTIVHPATDPARSTRAAGAAPEHGSQSIGGSSSSRNFF
jgi:hypothetical protein